MFETKHQMLHRLQEGISFGDGMDYTVAEYQRVASERTNAWKRAHYPDHDLLSRHAETTNASTDRKLFTPENLERDYWDIVEDAKGSRSRVRQRRRHASLWIWVSTF